MPKRPRTTTTALPASGFVRQSTLLAHIIPISSATLWRNVRAGKFPAPIKLSARVTAWRVEDVRAWIESKAKDCCKNQHNVSHANI
jgi:prophage regulatory protein